MVMGSVRMSSIPAAVVFGGCLVIMALMVLLGRVGHQIFFLRRVTERAVLKGYPVKEILF